MEEKSQENQEQQQQPQQQVNIDEGKLNQYLEELRLQQNLPLGIGAGVIASLIGAVLWAVITVATGYQIGYMAIAVGLLVGFAIKFAGKGIDKIFGIAGAILALLGCALGNFLSIIGFVAAAENLTYFEILSTLNPSIIVEIMA